MKPGGLLWWILAVAGLLLFMPAAWLGSRSPGWLVLFVPLLLVWGVWLIRDYMLWYRRLGADPAAGAPQARERPHGLK